MKTIDAATLATMAAAGLTLATAGCTATSGGAAGDTASAARTAVADLRTATNTPAGTATATQTAGGGIRVEVNVENIPQGSHGIHVHTVGRCDAPTFESAGGHWNPTGAHHGVQNPATPKPHAGDMPNLMVGADGRGSIAVDLPAGTFDGLMDADGSAFVVHANADDLRSDPSGNSGGRIACGVFRAT